MDQCLSFFQISIVKFKMSMYAFDSFGLNVQTFSFTLLPLKGHTVWHLALTDTLLQHNNSVCLFMSVCCFICVEHVCVWYIHTFSILFLLLCTFYVIFLIHQHVQTHNVSQYMIRLLVVKNELNLTIIHYFYLTTWFLLDKIALLPMP